MAGASVISRGAAPRQPRKGLQGESSPRSPFELFVGTLRPEGQSHPARRAIRVQLTYSRGSATRPAKALAATVAGEARNTWLSL